MINGKMVMPPLAPRFSLRAGRAGDRRFRVSLVNKPVLTPEKIAANQANGRRSHGPATPEGRERIREANARHGFYATGEALRMLGEDPEEFEHLLESLTATWEPADEFQARLVKRLARALWRMERSDRMQEGMAVEQLERLDANVDRLAREAGSRYEGRLASLNALIDAAGQASFCTGFPELQTFNSLWGDNPKGKPGEISFSSTAFSNLDLTQVTRRRRPTQLAAPRFPRSPSPLGEARPTAAPILLRAYPSPRVVSAMRSANGCWPCCGRRLTRLRRTTLANEKNCLRVLRLITATL
jgi:hypothetical protein